MIPSAGYGGAWGLRFAESESRVSVREGSRNSTRRDREREIIIVQTLKILQKKTFNYIFFFFPFVFYIPASSCFSLCLVLYTGIMYYGGTKLVLVHDA